MLRCLQSFPMYPGEQPFKQDPLMWWQWSPATQFPQGCPQFLPNLLLVHSVVTMKKKNDTKGLEHDKARVEQTYDKHYIYL